MDPYDATDYYTKTDVGVLVGVCSRSLSATSCSIIKQVPPVLAWAYPIFPGTQRSKHEGRRFFSNTVSVFIRRNIVVTQSLSCYFMQIGTN